MAQTHTSNNSVREAKATLTSVLRSNWFLLGLLSAVLFGILFPGAGDTLNPAGITTTIIVFALFLSAGFTLPSEKIMQGLANYKLHIYIQFFVFVVIPIYFFLAAPLFANYLDGYLVYGLFALAVLPTTISTGVVFTQTTGGNTAGALFNAAFSNVVGIFLSPLLLSLFLVGSEIALPTEEIIDILGNLTYTMLLPIVLGQATRRKIPHIATRMKRQLSNGSNALILTVVFLTISATAADPMFLSRLTQLGLPFLFLAVSHIIFSISAYYGATLIGMNMPDRICVLFMAPQKTLAVGVPLLSVYFAGRPEILAMALLPLLFYHPFQLLFAGILRTLPAFKRAAEAS